MSAFISLVSSGLKIAVTAAFAAALIAISVQPALAQGWVAAPVLVPQPLVDVVALHRDAQRGGGRSQDEPNRPIRPSIVNPATLRFTPSLPLRRSMEAKMVATVKQIDSSGTLSALITRTPPITAMHQRMMMIGFALNDVSSALATFLATQWVLANGSATLPPRAYMLGLKAQYSQGLSAQPTVSSATDAAKQQYAEGLLLKAYVFSSLMEAAEGDAQAIAQLRAGAVQELKDFGIDHAQVTLTAQGFVAAE